MERERQLSIDIIDIFEDTLSQLDVTLPSPDRKGNRDGARIYGSVYYDLEDQVTNFLSTVKKEYMLLSSLSNNQRNVEILLTGTKEKCIEAKKLLESLESGYFVDMNNPEKTREIINELSKMGISLYDEQYYDDEFVPKIESLRIIETSDID